MLLARNILAVLVALGSLPVIVPILVLAVLFWLVSSITQTIASFAQRKHVPWNAIIQFESIIGWKTKPNLNTHYLAMGNDVCHVETDSHGWVGNSAISESDVVVFGDSYAFAYGVDPCDAYFHINSSLKIKAICSTGYDMVQEVLIMREWSSQLAGKLVVWFICLENDLYDNLQPINQHPQHVYPRPFVRKICGSSQWEIVTSHVDSSELRYHPPLRRLYAETFARLCTPSPLSRYLYSACEFLLTEGREICAKAGAQLVIMTIPNKLQLSERGLKSIASKLVDRNGFDPDFPDKQFGQMCRKLSVPFVPAKRYLITSDYKEFDWHWTKSGHQHMAQLIREVHEAYRAGTLSCSPSFS